MSTHINAKHMPQTTLLDARAKKAPTKRLTEVARLPLKLTRQLLMVIPCKTSGREHQWVLWFFLDKNEVFGSNSHESLGILTLSIPWILVHFLTDQWDATKS